MKLENSAARFHQPPRACGGCLVRASSLSVCLSVRNCRNPLVFDRFLNVPKRRPQKCQNAVHVCQSRTSLGQCHPGLCFTRVRRGHRSLVRNGPKCLFREAPNAFKIIVSGSCPKWSDLPPDTCHLDLRFLLVFEANLISSH